MQTHERQFVLDHLAATEERLLALTAGLTPAQWHFHDSPERWSIAENLEHCILTERLIGQVIAGAFASPAQPEKMAAAAGKEIHVASVCMPVSRTHGLVAVQPLQPTGRWTDPAVLLSEFKAAHAASVEYATTIDGDLRSHFYPHQALGDLDCYQWLVVQAQHGARHALQIEELKANPAYPKS